MYRCDLPVDQFADENIGAVANELSRTVNLMRLRMSPPTPADGSSCNGGRQAWRRSSRSLKDNSMVFNKSERLFGADWSTALHEGTVWLEQRLPGILRVRISTGGA